MRLALAVLELAGYIGVEQQWKENALTTENHIKHKRADDAFHWGLPS